MECRHPEIKNCVRCPELFSDLGYGLCQLRWQTCRDNQDICNQHVSCESCPVDRKELFPNSSVHEASAL